MYRVRKRDGKIVSFDLGKIRKAMKKAFEACDSNYDDDVLDFLALKVSADFEKKVKDNIIDVEDIQDSVENVLIKADYSEVAKAYILYRDQHEKMRNISETLLDYKEVVDNYLQVNDLCRYFLQ